MTKRLRNIIIFPTVSVILALVLFITVFIMLSLNRASNEIAQENAHIASGGIRVYMEEFGHRSTAATRLLVDNPQFVRLVRDNGDHNELYEFLASVKYATDIDYFSVRDYEGRVLVRTYDLERFGDISQNPTWEAARDGKTITTFYSDPATPLVYYASMPIFYDGRFLGNVTAGLHIGEPAFLDKMSTIFNVELAFYYGNRMVVSTFLELNDDEEIFADAEISESVLQNKEGFVGVLTIDGLNYSSYYFPLLNSDNEAVGMIAAAFSQARLNAIDYALLPGVILFGLVATTIAIIILLGTVSRISKPIVEANERVQLLFDASPTAMFLFDENYKAIDCNKKAQELFGYATKQDTLDHSPNIMPPTQPNGEKSYAALNVLVKKAFKTGFSTSDFLFQKMDGTLLPVEITQVLIKHNNADVLAEYIIDLRALKEAEEKMRYAHELNQLILDSAPLVMTIRNAENKISRVSKQALDIFGIEDQQYYIGNWFKLSPEFQPCGTPTKEKAASLIADAFRYGKVNFEWMYRTEDDQPLPMDVTLVKFRHGDQDMLVTYAFDIRPIKEALQKAIDIEQQAKIAERESEAKSRFLAQISHEIRTPMNAVLGIAEIQLQNSNLSVELRDSLSHIRTSSYLLLAIINNLLDLSKAEAGKMEIVNKPYETISLIVDTAQLNMFYIGSKRIEFVVNADYNLPAALLGDELRIKQVLNNLLSNAFKYTKEGIVELSLSAIRDESASPEDVSLLIRVKDTGMGMTRSQVRRLFSEEYVRFNEDDSTEGSGLGMMIAHQLVNMMGGKIEIESVPGKSTLVTLLIPQKAVGDGVIGKEQAQKLHNFEFSNIARYQVADFTREPMPYGQVLIVDDVELNLYVAKGHLSPYLLDIDTAMSGFEALDMVESGKIYDIVFMDHMMPDMDGIETVERMRDNGYKGAIVALTANALVGNAGIFLQHRFDDFLSKPIDIRELDQILHKFISSRHPEASAKYKNTLKFLEEPTVNTDIETTATPMMLEMFKRDVENAIVTMRETFAGGDIKLFTITVHSIKSSLLYFGEDELSRAVAMLERAGNDRNMEYIDLNLGNFIEKLEALLQRLEGPQDEISEARDGGEEPDPVEDLDYLAKRLREVESACLDFDIKLAVSSVEALLELSWKKETVDTLKKMRDTLFLDSNFDMVLEMLKEFDL